MAETLGVQLRFSWGDARLAEHFLTPASAKRFVVGPGPDCDFVTGGERFVAVSLHGGEYLIHVPADTKAQLIRGIEAVDLDKVVRRGEAAFDGRTYSLFLSQGGRLRADLGGICMEAFQAAAPPLVSARFLQRFDAGLTRSLGAIALIAVLLGLSSAREDDPPRVEAAETHPDYDQRIARLAIVQSPSGPNRFLERLAQQKRRSRRRIFHDSPEAWSYAAAMGNDQGTRQQWRRYWELQACRAAAGGSCDDEPSVTDFTAPKVEVLGGLNANLVGAVIQSHRDQIRYCYEIELTRAHRLSGKVGVKFVISSVGLVAAARVDQSTINNVALESCIARRSSTWVFPKPKGGGVAVVRYAVDFVDPRTGAAARGRRLNQALTWDGVLHRHE